MAKQLKEIEIPFGAKDSELYGWEYTIPEGMEATIVDNKIVVKKKESEDERIRKELIDFLEYYRLNNVLDSKTILLLTDSVAWLEKQGDKSDIGISFTTKQKLEDNLNKALQKETPESWNKFLDEQGEQKARTLEQAANIFLDALSNTPYNNKPITDAQVITKELLKFLSDARSYNHNAINEQKPDDKVEPKFKVGDWITDGEKIWKIGYMGNNMYNLQDIELVV